MKPLSSNYFIFPTIAIVIFGILLCYSINLCYFWDTIQQITKEAHWYYLNDFKYFLMPEANAASEIVATGYHPPLMGIMTALLWKIFGYHLAVSHLFIFGWALILIYNLQKLLNHFIEAKYAGWVLLIILFEPTVLTQFVIASPDFILFTAFVISLRAILEKKSFLLAIALVFLCGINMRGLFAGVILFFMQQYYTYLLSNNKLSFNRILSALIPFFPVLILLAIYYSYYFIHRGWFFTNQGQGSHYAAPQNIQFLIKHLLEFGIRALENGRFIVWILAAVCLWFVFKKKVILGNKEKALLFFFIGLFGLYFTFIFISQMPFSSRYFLPFYVSLTVLCFSLVLKHVVSQKKVYFIIILTLVLELSGNFWIYPERISKAWDCSLAHTSFYSLRKECFDYIDTNKLDYNEISGGFCLYGNRKYIELIKREAIVHTKEDNRYYIYSNISNINDDFREELKSGEKWQPVKSFQKGFVEITIYEQIGKTKKASD